MIKWIFGSTLFSKPTRYLQTKAQGSKLVKRRTKHHLESVVLHAFPGTIPA
jgi:hypothetical protein